MYVFNLDSAAFLFVPPAPSSTIIKSASARSAFMSDPPSISRAVKATFPAVDIVASLESAIAALDLISALTIFVIVLLSESIDLFVQFVCLYLTKELHHYFLSCYHPVKSEYL